MTLDECRDAVEAKVVYHAPHQDPMTTPGEEGIITSVNDYLVFVRYRGDAYSKATRPGDLTKVAP